MDSVIYTNDDIIKALMDYTGWDRDITVWYVRQALQKAANGLYKQYQEILEITNNYYINRYINNDKGEIKWSTKYVITMKKVS